MLYPIYYKHFETKAKVQLSTVSGGDDLLFQFSQSGVERVYAPPKPGIASAIYEACVQ